MTAGRYRAGIAALCAMAVISLGPLLAGCLPDQTGEPVDVKVPPSARVGYPAREGDTCSPAGARHNSSTGVELVCGRFKGLGYDTWGRP